MKKFALPRFPARLGLAAWTLTVSMTFAACDLPPETLVEEPELATSTDAIVNGKEAQAGQFPGVAALFFALEDGDEHGCGGTLIGAKTVLTAAHCVMDGLGGTIPPATFKVVFNRLRLSSIPRVQGRLVVDGRDVFAVSAVHRHPGFQGTPGHDVALLELASAPGVPHHPLVSSRAEEQMYAAPNAPARIVGWGFTRFVQDAEAGPQPVPTDRLLTATTRVRRRQVCEAAAAKLAPGDPILTLQETELCAGGTSRGACHGDSGGPLLVDTRQGPAVAGVVSRGFAEQCPANTPAAFARVSDLASWIHRCMSSAALCATP